nr:PDZ domain-containing protein [Mucilaginibacter aquariorum]
MPVEALSKNAIASDAILKALGIEVSNLTSEEKNRLKLSGGVKIVSISPGKIAGQTGIRTGFIVTGVDGQPVNTTSDFIQKLQDKKGGVMLEGVYANRPGVYYYAFGL